MSEPRGETGAERGLVYRGLNLITDVRPGEAGTAFVLLASIFVLLVSYYVLKTVREPLVMASAEQDLQLVRNTDWPAWLKQILIEQQGQQLKALAAGFQAILLAFFVPAYSWIASHVSRARLIIGVTLFFIGCIELFFFLRLAGVPMLGFVFYIWVGVFSVAMIAQFWSFANDIYSEEQGKRLFPLIGIGATAGSPLGSKVAKWLYEYLAPESETHLDAIQRWAHDGHLDPSFILLQAPAVTLLVFMLLMVWVSRRVGVRGRRKREAPESEAAMDRHGGFRLLLKSPYVRLIALVILVLNLVNTTGELLLSGLVNDAAEAAVAANPSVHEGVWIGEFYGDYLFWVSILAFLLQAFVVSRIVKYTGLAGVLLALPIVALGTYSLFSAGLGLMVLRLAKTAENATDYSVMNTGKAMVWLPTTRAAKYKGKQAVDTFVVRVGDVLSALLFLVGTSALGMGLRSFAFVNLALVALWLGLTFLLLRQRTRIAAAPEMDPAAAGGEPSAAAAS